MRRYFQLAIVLAVLIILIAACSRQNVAVMVYGEHVGNTITARNGYYIPLEVAAKLADVELLVDTLARSVLITYPDDFEFSFQADDAIILWKDDEPYIQARSLGTIFGLKGVLVDGSLNLQPLKPSIKVESNVASITLNGSSALAISGEWVSDSLYEISVPVDDATGSLGTVTLSPDSYYLGAELSVRDEALIIGLQGDYRVGLEPRVRFTSGRTAAVITWSRYMPLPVKHVLEGQGVLEFAVPTGCEVRLLAAFELAAPPIVRLRQRSNLLGGPSVFFPVAQANLSVGTEGEMISYNVGWVKVRLANGTEGWFQDKSVSIRLQTPAYPLTLRSMANSLASVVTVIPPNSELILKEKVEGGYLAAVVGESVEGYLLDGQVFWESLFYMPKEGLRNVARAEVIGALPPLGSMTSDGLLQVVDAVEWDGNAMLTFAVPEMMNLSMKQTAGGFSVAAGVVIDELILTDVASGQQLEIKASGRHDIKASRTATGVTITIPYGSLSSVFKLPALKGAITSIEARQLSTAVEIDIATSQQLGYRVHDLRTITVLSPKLAGKTIVIDPGHGGRDPGATGTLGWDEKDFSLDMASRLAEELHALGAIPILTHKGVPLDTKMAIEERWAIVNQAQSDLFLSIHLNAFTLKSARGAETYYLNKEENVRLAELLQNALVSAGMRDRGIIESKTLALLRNGQPPGVLLELGYLSNLDDERYLSNPNTRQAMAREIARGIEAFFLFTK